jgi:hypothetical protein
VRKLAAGFVQRGYQFIEITRSEELTYLSRADIVYVSNHLSVDPLHRPFRGLLEKRLARILATTPVRAIFWSFHTLSNWDICKRPNTIQLGEDVYDSVLEAEPVLKRFRQTHPVVSLRYASPLHPDYAPPAPEDRDVAFNFIGSPYRTDLTSYCRTRYGAIVRNTPPTVAESLRVNAYKRAEINLVFHAQANKRKGIIVERFAEALSYGGLIIHDHPRITAEFGDVPSIFFAGSPAEIDQVYGKVRVMPAPEKRALRDASIARWKASGLSYFHQAGRILDAFGG